VHIIIILSKNILAKTFHLDIKKATLEGGFQYL